MTLDLDLILSAVAPGGPSALSSTTPLRPAAGEQAAVAPAKYVLEKKYVPEHSKGDTYQYDWRYIGGEPQRTVLLDSSQSMSNRIERVFDLAIHDGNDVLGRIPRVRVTYEHGGTSESFTDITLPHRVFDAHIRAGSINGVPTTAVEAYRAARNATPLNARALFDLSPASLVFGSWDASRKARQGRWPSALTGEIIGTVTDQGGENGPRTPRKGGARVDPVGMSINVDGPTLKALAEAQKDDLSPKTYQDIITVAKKLKAGETTSASALGFGGIPPTLNQLGGVSCKTIVRSRVLSFAALRQIRFGAGEKGDAACRAVLAALAVNGIVRSDAELYLRAHCFLVEAGPSTTEIDRRHGEMESVILPSIAEADQLLADAMRHAEDVADLDWHGQVFEVTGDPQVLAGGVDETVEGD